VDNQQLNIKKEIVKVKTKSKRILELKKQKKKLKKLAKKKLIVKKKIIKKKKKPGRSVEDAVSEYKAHLAKTRPPPRVPEPPPPPEESTEEDPPEIIKAPTPPPQAVVVSPTPQPRPLSSLAISREQAPTPPPGAFINPAISARRASNASQSSNSAAGNSGGGMDELQQIKEFINQTVAGSVSKSTSSLTSSPATKESWVVASASSTGKSSVQVKSAEVVPQASSTTDGVSLSQQSREAVVSDEPSNSVSVKEDGSCKQQPPKSSAEVDKSKEDKLYNIAVGGEADDDDVIVDDIVIQPVEDAMDVDGVAANDTPTKSVVVDASSAVIISKPVISFKDASATQVVVSKPVLAAQIRATQKDCSSRPASKPATPATSGSQEVVDVEKLDESTTDTGLSDGDVAVVETPKTGGKKKKKDGGGKKRSLGSNAPESPSKRKQLLEEEELEQCEECKREFRGYFSLMRHYAFTHQKEKTATLLKLNLLSQPRQVRVSSS